MIFTAESMRFAINRSKSQLTLTLLKEWLGISWDSSVVVLHLSCDYRMCIHSKVMRVRCSHSITHRVWEILLSSLNFIADVLPLGQLQHRWLTWLGNKAFLVTDQDMLHILQVAICS